MMVAQAQRPREALYQELLSAYLHSGSENSLHVAYELGREDLQNGVGLLEVAETHQQALDLALGTAENCRARRSEMNKAASRFLKETLSSFEVSRLCSRQTNDALIKLYELFESEAKRIAHRLHDESAQILAVVYLELAEIAKHATGDTALRIGSVVRHLDEVTSQLRNLSHELRPLILDQLGLMPALRALTEGVRKRSQMKITLSGSTDGRLSPELETVVYRAVQEALANTCRHASASKAEVRVWRENAMLCCAVTDNGLGFAMNSRGMTHSHGLGLVGIRERTLAQGGQFQISSQPGHGTTLHVSIPL